MAEAEHLEALAERISALEAKEAIRDAIYRYCRGLDRLDAAMIRSAFHPDAELDYGANLYQGNVEAFVPMAIGFHEQLRDVQHSVGQVLIENLSDERAEAESYVRAVQLLPVEDEAPMELIVHARYLDVFEKRDNAWKIAHRMEVIDHANTRAQPADWFATAGDMNRGGPKPDDPLYRFFSAR